MNEDQCRNKKQSEIVFLYDVRLANPNGDPANDNAPRYDEENGYVYVTDVRLKRTIRDYLMNKEGKEIFIINELNHFSQITDVSNNPKKTKADRFNKDFGRDINEAIKRCIDLRLFGFTIAVGNKKDNKKKQDLVEGEDEEGRKVNISALGPVQFDFGLSMNTTKIINAQITSSMPNQESKSGGEFADRYVVPYVLISQRGIVNRRIAEIQDIPLTEDDLYLMYKAMWRGTSELNTSSKSDKSRLLLVVDYKDGYFDGEIDEQFKLIPVKEGKIIYTPEQFVVEISNLVNHLEKIKNYIERIRIKESAGINFTINGEKTTVTKEIKKLGIPVEEFVFEENK
jgi:CRISPR-associated protein Csh2